MARRKVRFNDEEIDVALEKGNYLRSSVRAEIDGQLIVRRPHTDKLLAAESSLVHHLLPYVAAGQWACANAHPSDGAYWCILIADKESRRERPPTTPRQFPHAEWQTFVAECVEMACRMGDAHQGRGKIDIPTLDSASEPEVRHYHQLVFGAQILASYGGNQYGRKFCVPTKHDGVPLLITTPTREIVEVPTDDDLDEEPGNWEPKKIIRRVERVITFVKLSTTRLVRPPDDQDWSKIVKGGYVEFPDPLRSIKTVIDVVDEPLVAVDPDARSDENDDEDE